MHDISEEKEFLNTGSTSFLNNPYPTYSNWRLNSPVFYSPSHQAWLVTCYKDVLKVLKDPNTFSSDRPLTSSPGGLGYRFMLFSQDPPEHNHLRSVIKHAFTTRRIKEIESWANQQIELLLHALPKDSFDIATQLTIPFPIMVVTEMLGIRQDKWQDLKRWTEMIVGHHNKDSHLLGRKAFLELHALFKNEIEIKKRKPSEDIISHLVLAEYSGGTLSDIEIINFCTTLLVAGNETTASLMSNMFNILGQNPELWERLRKDRSLVQAVVEETLRYDSPVQYVNRTITQPVYLSGQQVNEGETIICCLGSANRDGDIFINPDVFDPERSQGKHLAFSHGIHFCVGAALSRMEACLVLNQALDRFHRIEISEPGSRYENMFFRGFKHLKLDVTT
ncbi:monooxygenase YjiB [Aurantivibrio plasticivorans]